MKLKPPKMREIFLILALVNLTIGKCQLIHRVVHTAEHLLLNIKSSRILCMNNLNVLEYLTDQV